MTEALTYVLLLLFKQGRNAAFPPIAGLHKERFHVKRTKAQNPAAPEKKKKLVDKHHTFARATHAAKKKIRTTYHFNLFLRPEAHGTHDRDLSVARRARPDLAIRADMRQATAKTALGTSGSLAVVANALSLLHLAQTGRAEVPIGVRAGPLPSKLRQEDIGPRRG